MITLFLDTSIARLIVALYRDNECLFLENEEAKNDLSGRVLPKIKYALNKCELLVDDIDKIIVVNGPGSFTGIRVGVTIAKTLAWAKKINIVPISSLELMATTKVDTEYVVPLIDARRDAFFAGMYDKKNNPIFNESYITRTDLMNKIKRHTSKSNVSFICYTEIPELETRLPEINIEYIIKKYSKKNSLNPHAINPNYLKLVEAEEKLNDTRNK